MEIQQLHEMVGDLLRGVKLPRAFRDYIREEKISISRSIVDVFETEYTPSVEHAYGLFSLDDNLISASVNCNGQRYVEGEVDIDISTLNGYRADLQKQGFRFVGTYHSHPPTEKRFISGVYYLPPAMEMCPAIPSGRDILCGFSENIPNHDVMCIGYRREDSFVLRAFVPLFADITRFITMYSRHYIKGQGQTTAQEITRLKSLLKNDIAIIELPESMASVGFVELGCKII